MIAVLCDTFLNEMEEMHFELYRKFELMPQYILSDIIVTYLVFNSVFEENEQMKVDFY